MISFFLKSKMRTFFTHTGSTGLQIADITLKINNETTMSDERNKRKTVGDRNSVNAKS